ncbi:hypothetical protein [Streptomyces sp. NBC_00566]|uniref:hypothetical protein n=2 Tax=unclassified Streptomyces TaxID=2593676 RepID=UPI002E824B78|nr:hypothetical protein [Streptomyces sp. NBC_00566]WUB87411.1 hypothetical protein OG812_12775 [Streptomyces sp. NBC_00566]
MTKALADTALAALRQQPAEGVADVWTDGDLGFVLLLHRRKDGAMAEELYCAQRAEDGTWDRPEHLNGGLLGLDPGNDPTAVTTALAGEPIRVLSASETLLHTGRGEEDGYETAHIWQLLITPEADALTTESTHRKVTSPLSLLILFPGETAHVSATRDARPLGAPLTLSAPTQPEVG